MITSNEIMNVVLPVVALRKKELHNKMLSVATDEELITLKRNYEEYSKFENWLTREMKASESTLFRELNK